MQTSAPEESQVSPVAGGGRLRGAGRAAREGGPGTPVPGVRPHLRIGRHAPAAQQGGARPGAHPRVSRVQEGLQARHAPQGTLRCSGPGPREGGLPGGVCESVEVMNLARRKERVTHFPIFGAKSQWDFSWNRSAGLHVCVQFRFRVYWDLK